MHSGTILKSAQALDAAELEKVNRYTLRPFGEEEVYTFRVVLCDNDIDRDGDCFETGALQKLGELFLGKTGIFNHSMDASTQTARIYDTGVETVEGRTTARGEPYCRLVARAYLPRCEKFKDLMLEIDSGIKKEVSVGCAVGSTACSICGADLRRERCEHQKGKRYGGEVCCAVLSDPRDAYEWSFVAVPAQREAGVTKAYAAGEADDALWGRKYREKLMEETAKAFSLLHPDLERDAVRRMTAALAPEELEAVESCLKKSAGALLPLTPQLLRRDEERDAVQNEAYRI